MSKVKDITSFLLEKYPLDLCSSFDNGKTGLQFGSYEKVVKKALICLDGTSFVVDEALKLECDMLICHHPFMFSPMLNMNYDTAFGHKMLKVFQNELAIFAMHTNFDVSIDGMNEILAEKIGLCNVHPIKEVDNEAFMRIGNIPEMSLRDFAVKVKNNLGEEAVRVVGPLDKKITTVGVIGGSGGLYVMDAKRAGCDVIVTGEIKQNNAVDAIENNMAIIEVSHGAEANYREFIQKMLSDKFKDVKFVISKEDKNPFQVIK